MQIKKILSVALATMLCFTPVMQATATAAEPYRIVAPLYEIADKAWCDLTIYSSTANCISSVDNGCAVKITTEQYLQKQGFFWIWSTYDGAEWTKTVNTNVIAMSNTKTGLSSGKYRLKTIFTLTDKNGKTGTITIYSDEKTVG